MFGNHSIHVKPDRDPHYLNKHTLASFGCSSLAGGLAGAGAGAGEAEGAGAAGAAGAISSCM